MADHLDLVGETDARKWAHEFARRFPQVFQDGEGVIVNDVESLMVTWFANAIEAGRDAGTHASDAEWTDILDSAEFFELHPGDVLVIHIDRYLTALEAHRIVDRLQVLAPDNKVVIFDGIATSIDINGDEGSGESNQHQQGCPSTQAREADSAHADRG